MPSDNPIARPAPSPLGYPKPPKSDFVLRATCDRRAIGDEELAVRPVSGRIAKSRGNETAVEVDTDAKCLRCSLLCAPVAAFDHWIVRNPVVQGRMRGWVWVSRTT